MPSRHNHYPFERSYARNSVIIIALSIATLLILTFPSFSISLYQNTLLSSVAFASAAFGVRYMRFRKTLQALMKNGRIVVERPITRESDLGKALVVAIAVLIILAPILSIRLLDPMAWLSVLLGYILGLNMGDLTYYLFIRRVERSVGQAIYMFDSEDPLAQRRIVGYRLEKIRD